MVCGVLFVILLIVVATHCCRNPNACKTHEWVQHPTGWQRCGKCGRRRK